MLVKGATDDYDGFITNWNSSADYRFEPMTTSVPFWQKRAIYYVPIPEREFRSAEYVLA